VPVAQILNRSPDAHFQFIALVLDLLRRIVRPSLGFWAVINCFGKSLQVCDILW
jgi:hypothetical protein